MRDVLERIRKAQAEWRAECGSEPDVLYIGKQEHGQLKKQVSVAPDPLTGRAQYDGMEIVRNQRLQHLSVGRSG